MATSLAAIKRDKMQITIENSGDVHMVYNVRDNEREERQRENA